MNTIEIEVFIHMSTTEQRKPIKLIALDLDGTLFNNESKITPGNIKAINAAIQKGITVVISTGRPYAGMPFEQIKQTDINYSINTNGSAIYEIFPKKLICEEGMEPDFVIPIIEFLLTKDIHMDAFISGDSYTPFSCVPAGQKIDVPPELKRYILETRKRVDDLCEFIRANHAIVQKMTLNFYRDSKGTLVDRAAVYEYLKSNPSVNCVSGGYNNLEFTRSDVDKGVGLRSLASHLGIAIEETMAIGDTGNDIAILKAAGLGVAMGNATDDVKAVADVITGSNEEDGVASAIYKYALGES